MSYYQHITVQHTQDWDIKLRKIIAVIDQEMIALDDEIEKCESVLYYWQDAYPGATLEFKEERHRAYEERLEQNCRKRSELDYLREYISDALFKLGDVHWNLRKEER